MNSSTLRGDKAMSLTGVLPYLEDEMTARLNTLKPWFLISIVSLAVACGDKTLKNSGVQAESDHSASSAAAEVVGGALSGSVSSGTMASYKFNMQDNSIFAKIRSELSPMPSSFADLLCPTVHSTDSSCSTQGDTMYLTYNSCSFLGRAQWNGVQAIKMSSGASAVCGSFPHPGANSTLFRKYVEAANALVPSALDLYAGDLHGQVDDKTANLGNFDGESIAGISGWGYGVAVDFGANGTRSSVAFARRVAVDRVFDHSVVASGLQIQESLNASSRKVNGSVTVYHNLLKVIGDSELKDVIHSNQCCLPIGGTITTTFRAGQNVAPTRAGLKMIGKSETLTFTGCGSAVLEDSDGQARNVILNRCY